MFCPQCGTNQSEELKYCKACGANLYLVRHAVTTRLAPGEKTEWSKSWGELKRRQMEMEMYLSPEEKRYREIKGGVITSCVGLAVMIFLYVLMRGIILGGNVPANEAEILSRIWVAGLFPFLVGIGLLINGVIVSKRLVELANRELRQKDTARILDTKDDASLSSEDWYESDSPRPSVTENTTRQLRDSSKA
ncbi:MAG TPA: hypothetical protein VKA70_21355 [Blastocatellia bacterium]|nr:hypothetical protein [Blastocatellia bacterium]